ncbi:hypothetical protein [Catenulispora pinisilvae]|uniref:hypothetical protein n=1 Tax=Catenulispora pinisilvae TaxID=2705253 RepID=UPI00189266A2|nr:hypothetical protein [Catenulispora pinisilvae]
MSQPSDPRRPARRAVLGSLAAAAVGVPLALSEQASAATPGTFPTSGTLATPRTLATPAATPVWHPNPATDGLKAFEGLEFDRGNLFPGRHGDYIIVEGGDHYRFNIWKDDRDTTGGGDRQRTESRGMVAGGNPVKMTNGQTWNITYQMFMPDTLHGTSRFTHIFQTKVPSTNAGPFVTLDLTRESATSETLRARAYANSGSPTIASAPLAPLRNQWITIQWTLTIGQSGTARFVCLDSTGKTVADGTRHGVILPDQGDYIRPKWGIYRSVESAGSDIIDTHLLFRGYQASRV